MTKKVPVPDRDYYFFFLGVCGVGVGDVIVLMKGMLRAKTTTETYEFLKNYWGFFLRKGNYFETSVCYYYCCCFKY